VLARTRKTPCSGGVLRSLVSEIPAVFTARFLSIFVSDVSSFGGKKEKEKTEKKEK
jgi:hypothetical protein